MWATGSQGEKRERKIVSNPTNQTNGKRTKRWQQDFGNADDGRERSFRAEVGAEV